MPAQETLRDDVVALPFYRHLVPKRSWFANIEYPSSRTWLKIVIISGSATGAIVLGTWAWRRFSPLDKKRRANGTVIFDNGGASTSSSRAVSRKTTRDETCGGLAILLEEDQASNKSGRVPDDSVDLSSNRKFSSRRQRADSITSGTTTLLITNRTPSELLLYGLESLKRAIRLWEETRMRISRKLLRLMCAHRALGGTN